MFIVWLVSECVVDNYWYVESRHQSTTHCSPLTVVSPGYLGSVGTTVSGELTHVFTHSVRSPLPYGRYITNRVSECVVDW